FGSLGNLGNLGNLAQDAVKNLNTDDNKPAEQQSGSDSSNWGEVGSEAKKAFTDFQDKQSKGEKPNYAELGNVAKNAYSAYSKDDGPKDPT
ncbi:hypothetical protein NPN18_24715, partial [Vibrio parahaemolyticus]|nr:hypothetical protein [Vibrio parahaemolyticus]